MGPLFSILLVVLAMIAAITVVFFVAMHFQQNLWAIRSASVFVLGAVIGVAFSVVLSLFFVGANIKLTSSLQVCAYFSSLAFGGLLGGGLLLWLFIKNIRSPNE